MCVTPIARIILVFVCPHIEDILRSRSATPLRTSLYQGQQGDVNKFVHVITPVKMIDACYDIDR